MSAIELLLERNRSAAAPVAAATQPWLCLVTCDDPSLTGRLEALLGIAPGGATVVRLPGGGGFAPELLQRAVAKAVFLDGAVEVLLLGHKPCGLAAVSSARILEALTKANVSRTSVPGDLREFVGAGANPLEGLRQAAAALRRCGFLPASLLVHVAELDEATGKVSLVENGEDHRSQRGAQAGQVAVAGYKSGPAELAAPPPTALPNVAALAPTVELGQLTAPDVKAFAASPISVELPSITTDLPYPVVTAPGGPGVMTTQSLFGNAATVAGPQPQHTASSFLGEAPTSPDSPPELTRQKFLGEKFSAPEPPPQELTSKGLFGDPPPKAPAATAKQPPARAAQGQTMVPPVKGTRARPSGLQLGPELAQAVQKVRTFMAAEIGKNERRDVLAALDQAARRGAGSEELVKIALKPVLQSGSNRYKVIDELILVKEDATRMAPSDAAAVLREMIP